MLHRGFSRRTGSVVAALALAIVAVGCEADPSLTRRAEMAARPCCGGGC